MKSTRPVAHKSEVVEQDVGVVHAWVCPEVGVAMHKMVAFIFHSNLHAHNHVPRPNILKRQLWLASYVFKLITLVGCNY